MLLGPGANAQRIFRPTIAGPSVIANPQIAPGVYLQQYAYNTAVLGRALSQIPPYAMGYNPYPQVVAPTVPAMPISPLAGNPYALSTLGGYNPYLGTGGLGGTAALDNSPYSLSTTGGSGYGSPYGAYGSPYGYPGSYAGPVGSGLMGQAALTGATGQYLQDVQKARISRETSRQMAMENERRAIELRRWYESTQPTAQQLRDRQIAAVLDHVRKDASDVEINSGTALNVLLQSAQKAGQQINRGPMVPVDEDTLKHINVAGSGAAGNVGMLKDVTNLTWPEGLQNTDYEEARKRLSRNLIQAVTILKDKDPVPATTLKDIRADYKALNDKLNDAADDLSPSQYIESRRFLNQLNQAVRALSDPNVGKFFNNTWAAKGKNVAELISNMSRSGLNFAPAAPGDQSAYKALYLAMRQFEAGLELAKK